jgi:uncharacterized protein
MTTASLAHLAATTGALTAELEDWGPLEEAQDGAEMHTHGITLWEDGDQSVGLWECTAGPSYWVQDEHELIYVLTGSMTVTEDGGEAVEVKAGDTVMFPKGWSGTWLLHDTIRKVYAIF